MIAACVAILLVRVAHAASFQSRVAKAHVELRSEPVSRPWLQTHKQLSRDLERSFYNDAPSVIAERNALKEAKGQFTPKSLRALGSIVGRQVAASFNDANYKASLEAACGDKRYLGETLRLDAQTGECVRTIPLAKK